MRRIRKKQSFLQVNANVNLVRRSSVSIHQLCVFLKTVLEKRRNRKITNKVLKYLIDLIINKGENIKKIYLKRQKLTNLVVAESNFRNFEHTLPLII